jgi:endonuclease/exonuclease/phosphatase family metal-dependent hydrolase
MAGTVRIGTFNCHNLFSRVRVLNREDTREGDMKMKKIADLYTEINKDFYDNRQKIVDLYQDINTDKDGKPDYFIKIVDLRNNLLSNSKKQGLIVNPKVKGKKNWDGYISYVVSNFKKMARQNTARVITDIDADIISMMEIENKTVLDNFNSQLLFKTKPKKYEYSMSIDNVEDPRGIDVALLSRYPIVDIKTHMYDKLPGSSEYIFSRDCLEVTLQLPSKDSLYLLINHFKSQLGDTAKSDARRLSQVQRVADIIQQDRKYDLVKDKVVVLGDFNIERTNPSVAPLFAIKELKDILELDNIPAADRWTYYYEESKTKKHYQQLDYVLVSKPFWGTKLLKTGIQRKGIYNLETISSGKEKAWDEVQNGGADVQASDHAAVWAEFNY